MSYCKYSKGQNCKKRQATNLSCETFENPLHIDISPVRRTLSIHTIKLNDYLYEYKCNYVSSLQRTRYGSVQFLFSTRKMRKFSRTLHNRQFKWYPPCLLIGLIAFFFKNQHFQNSIRLGMVKNNHSVDVLPFNHYFISLKNVFVRLLTSQTHVVSLR